MLSSASPPLPLDPFFFTCLHEAANTPELVKEFDRLSGHNLSRHGSGLDLMIDDATGRTEARMKDFIEFVRTVIYEPLQGLAND